MNFNNLHLKNEAYEHFELDSDQQSHSKKGHTNNIIIFNFSLLRSKFYLCN